MAFAIKNSVLFLFAKGSHLLHEFLQTNEIEILAMTENKTLELAGTGPSSKLLKKGLPIFYKQLVSILQLEVTSRKKNINNNKNPEEMVQAAKNSNEPEIAIAAGRPEEVELVESAADHGAELLRLGYTLSHVVHAYGSMCQSITELATKKNFHITAQEFHDLNQCLDVAIAGAVTKYSSQRDTQKSNSEVEHLGFLAHELRNALNAISISHQMIKRGMVTIGGNTGQVLERGIRRMDELIDRSLTEVRLRVEPKIQIESINLLQFIDQIALTAEIEARVKKQNIDIQIEPSVVLEADQQLLHSALSNLIQNAIKYTCEGGRIIVRANLVEDKILIEVEDECGGLPANKADLFQAFEQQHANKSGLGLGLTIAKRAITLNQGTIDVQDLPGKGCIFKITLPHTLRNILHEEKLNPTKSIISKSDNEQYHNNAAH